MKLDIQVAATSQTVNVFIQDSSSTTGAGLSGLVYNSSGLTAYYALPKAASAAITLATLAAVTSAYSSGGFKEIDATNMKGWYRLDIPDAALASGRFVSIHLFGATNMAPLPIEIELTAWNNQDAVRGGMTALPNANAEAAGGLFTRGTGAGQINQESNGYVSVNLKAILGTVLTETAGQIAAAFKKFFDKATPTGTINSIPDAVAGAAGGIFIAGTNAATTASITGNITGNLSGSVGSVTGAVGSVTGAVGSVTGAVGSVTGAVGSVTGNVGGNVVGSVASVIATVNADVKKINGTTIVGDGSATPYNV